MATDKNRVQAYLSQDVYDSLVVFSELNQLSVSSAVEQLLTYALGSDDLMSLTPIGRIPKSSFSSSSWQFQSKVNSRLKALEEAVSRLELAIINIVASSNNLD